SEEDALKALTTTPAKLLNVSKKIGTLEKGKVANFIITSGNILSEKCVIYHNWIKGKPHVVKIIPSVDIRGTYELKLAKNTYTLKVEGSEDKPKISMVNPKSGSKKGKKGKKDSAGKVTIKHTLKNGTISFAFVPKKDTSKKVQDTYRLSGRVHDGEWSGRAVDPQGKWVSWSAKRTKAFEAKPLTLPKKVDIKTLGDVFYPFVGYGHTKEKQPKAETVLVQNATVWTGEAQGNLENTDVLIKDGKIAKIGKGLATEGAIVIDAKGKHLTAGIIDEHSHICISNGVNEATQASSAEVRIGDVVNSEDMNMYRQLAGGVTMSQLLHGSANPIGGQSAVIKFRWGQLPENMKFDKAKGFIKFALGENVKQSNWGSEYGIRFPQTRMGVEQVYEDYFTRAREYGEARKKLGDKVRRDLDLDAILEILDKERFITCHSYVQSEITMLMRVAERHNFRLNTFTHILEGYKIADKMKKHGAGGSTFSDWWAYKFEVMDAIPYNPKILDDMGVVVAINSDDAEMGRRLNQEAAKGVKYGGMSEEAAWNMVTLNPAKLLQIDDYVGSIKEGKQADVVLWSAHPMSVYARAEKTFVDGICYFDEKEDQAKRAAVQIERTRLVQKMLGLKQSGKPTQPVVHMHSIHYHCGDTGLNHVDFLQGLDK
ncbi:MAG: amidohydrolase family protein, partial [Saprospiraceae bacterium]|nr:amidohydrolase family protein [Saprospiraceae bacterium]